MRRLACPDSLLAESPPVLVEKALAYRRPFVHFAQQAAGGDE
jgi:hypothetical protein